MALETGGSNPLTHPKTPHGIPGARASIDGWPHRLIGGPMRPASFTLTLAAAAVLFPMLLVACGGDADEGFPEGHALSERFLRLGEELGTEIEAFDGALPPTLSDALNPDRTAETPEEDLLALPVHPDGVLLGSYRIRRDDGINTFILFYDVEDGDRSIEAALRDQLDESPWQVIGGQSTESLSWVSFQSTVSGDVDGQAAITPLPAVEGEDGGTRTISSIAYFLNIQPAVPPDPLPFVLPPSREPPADFPLPFLLEGMDVLDVAWLTQPGRRFYQATLLSTESAFDVAERYREAFAAVGWEVQEDRAVGFATVVSFASEDGTAVAQLTIDAFEEDDTYTAVLLQLQEGS